MKTFFFYILCLVLLVNPDRNFSQHLTQINAQVDLDKKTLTIEQEIVYENQSKKTIDTLVLNDWNHAFSNKKTPLAQRFSDEFYRGLQLSKTFERGGTFKLNITDGFENAVSWIRPEKNPDLIFLQLNEPLLPNKKTVIKLSYITKVPSDRFTEFGYTNTGGMSLKNWFLCPARLENGAFVRNSNENLDDIANAIGHYSIRLKVPKNTAISTDLDSQINTEETNYTTYTLQGNNRTDFSLFIEPRTSFFSYKNDQVEVISNLKNNKLNNYEKAILIDKIAQFTARFFGAYPHNKVLVSQAAYNKNPFYGLQQLPSFLNPFGADFVFEVQFLKSYLETYLKSSLNLDPRKDNWIFDGLQMYAMQEYMKENHPESKMFGKIARYKLLKNFHLLNLDFNEQYSYFYMLMARKNLDQPLGAPKNSLIKFNEQFANKYHAGLSLDYLNAYVGNRFVPQVIQDFYALNQKKQTSRVDFEMLLKSKTNKNINWFFETLIDSRKAVDYKIKLQSKNQDSVTFSIKNKTNTPVPVPIYGLRKKEIVFKKWITQAGLDSTFTLARNGADQLVLNYNNELPEFNLRNNWKSLRPYALSNRPIKFTFLRDVEDPKYNQIFYVPTIGYNLYDGLTPGIQLNNNSLLIKPFTFSVTPSYSTTTQSLSGSASISVNKDYRESSLYNVRYFLSGSYFHYAPDANYMRINPSVVFRIREPNYRDNKRQTFIVRQVTVDREKSIFETKGVTENYSVFNVKYFNSKTEVTNHFNLMTDLQFASKFGKIAGDLQYRKLFDNNRQIYFRGYLGCFLYNKSSSDFFSFALDRPSDYLFDYNYLGRSESTGFYSQELILAEGGFKSKLPNPFASQWITTFNSCFTLWNWVEAYGDVGLLKNKNQATRLVYDAGIRLNFVMDYFELYFPIYSNNGWEIGQKNYNEKIRFIVTFSPQTLSTLFTRKWF